MESAASFSTSFPYFFALFSVVYLLGYFKFFRNWSSKYRHQVSSCLISSLHGTPVVCLAIAALIQYNSGFAEQNTSFQNLVMDYSIGYFAVDLLHLLIFFSGENCLFIAHHLATMFVLGTCHYIVFRGAYEVLTLLIIAESTSACQNFLKLAEFRRNELPLSAKLYEHCAPPFCVAYFIARGIIGPLFLLQMSAFHLSEKARGLIPLWISISWILVVATAIVTSIMWIGNFWLEFKREKDVIHNNRRNLRDRRQSNLAI